MPRMKWYHAIYALPIACIIWAVALTIIYTCVAIDWLFYRNRQ